MKFTKKNETFFKYHSQRLKHSFVPIKNKHRTIKNSKNSNLVRIKKLSFF